MLRSVLSLSLAFGASLALGCTDARFIDDGSDLGAVDLGATDLGAASDAAADAGDSPDLGTEDMGPDLPDMGPCDPCRPTTGQVVITEIMVDSDVASDDFGEWFEVHNPSADVTYDLIGCVFSDSANSYVVDKEMLVPPGEFISLARFATAAEGGFVPDHSYGATLKFANEGDFLRMACGSVLVDMVDFTTWFVAKGRAFSLDPDSYDATANDEAASWCPAISDYAMAAGETDYGSPGFENPQCL